MNDYYFEVLEKYEGEAPEVRRGRGAWICSYPDRVRLLKEYRGSIKRLEFEETVLKTVREQGILMVDLPVRNLENELLTAAGDGTKYILKEWFLERECFLGDSREIMSAVSGISRLHHALRQIPWQEEWSLDSMLPPGPGAEMQRHNRELKRIRNYIRTKKKKNDFELCVIHNFSFFMEQAVKAQEGLSRLEQECTQENQYLCHGDLDQHHVLLKGSETGFIEFNQMHRGNQMEDLYHFMRKALEKHNWKEELGLAILEAYDRIQALTSFDRRYLYYLFLYPEKYWKQLNFYYNSNKAWLSERSMEKLKHLEEQQEQKHRFLEKIQS